MNYLMVDISGKVLNYDIALCEAMFKVLSDGEHLIFFAANIDPSKIDCPSKRLISLVPKSLKNSENKIKRGMKAIEGVVNYLYLLLYILFHRVDVLHFQWLPFLEICSMEKIFLQMIRIVSPKTKIVLTVHNLYPHNFSDKKKASYSKRFDGIKNFINVFILHLECSKVEFCNLFKVASVKVKVIHHGIFVPQNLKIDSHTHNKTLNLIMYGNQSYYKGTDIFIDALNLLPEESKKTVRASIVGKIDNDFYQELKQKARCLNIEWVPEFVSDEYLYEKIKESDVIVIPYREISQSGVLLLALSFKRIIIASDLPSFKETLTGCSDEIFFENGSAKSLAQVIEKVSNGQIDMESEVKKLDQLQHMYSWEKIATRYKVFFVS